MTTPTNNRLGKWKIAFLIFLIAGTIYILRNNKPYTTDSGNIFGTSYSITYQSDKELHEEIRKTLSDVDNSLSTFNRNSLITAVNENRDTIADEMFTTVFNLAREISAKTDGAFDITVAPLVNAWGFGFRKGILPDSAAVDSLRRHIGYSTVALKGNKIEKLHKETMLDCSAIAKGFGCDAVAATLDRHGIENYMVEIGGEVVAKGVNDKGGKWRIGISKPTDNPTASSNELHKIISITGKSMATSGNYRNYRIENGKKLAHTIDPRTGYPVNHNLLSATVIADDCATADAYATAFMVVGMEKAMEICRENSGIEAYFIYSDENGTLKNAETEGMKRYY